MYQISGGGYGGNAGHDGLSNGCSTIGISKSPPVEIMEQAYPVLYRHYALREGSGGAGKHRGGFGLAYEVELLRGEARASFVMDHGRFGPQGALGGADGAVNTVTVFRDGEAHVPPHLSKEQDIPLKAGDRVQRRHAGRRRLWRSARARSGTGAARRRAGLLHGGRGQAPVRSSRQKRHQLSPSPTDPDRPARNRSHRSPAWPRSSPSATRTSNASRRGARRSAAARPASPCRWWKRRRVGTKARERLVTRPDATPASPAASATSRLLRRQRRQRFLGDLRGQRNQPLDRLAALRRQADQQPALVDLMLGQARPDRAPSAGR